MKGTNRFTLKRTHFSSKQPGGGSISRKMKLSSRLISFHLIQTRALRLASLIISPQSLLFSIVFDENRRIMAFTSAANRSFLDARKCKTLLSKLRKVGVM